MKKDKIAICISHLCPIIMTSFMKLVKDTEKRPSQKEVTDKQAEEAFRTILSWIGEDPNREGLIDTQKE